MGFIFSDSKKMAAGLLQPRKIVTTGPQIAPVKSLVKAAGAERVGSDAAQELAVLL